MNDKNSGENCDEFEDPFKCMGFKKLIISDDDEFDNIEF